MKIDSFISKGKEFLWRGDFFGYDVKRKIEGTCCNLLGEDSR